MESQRSAYRPSLHLITKHYAMRPTIQYPLQHEAMPVYTNPAKQSVFDRLYQHSSIQRTNRESQRLEQTLLSPRRTLRASAQSTASGADIAEALVHKDKKSKERIMQLRTKYLNEELSGLRPVPQISEESKRIMERVYSRRAASAVSKEEARQPANTEEQRVATDPAVVESQRSPRLSSPPQQTQPSPTRSLSHNESNMIRAMMLHGKLTTSPRVAVPRIPERREETEVIKRVTLQSLREEVMTRFKGLEPELPPDYFSLPFESRNRVFLENRSAHLQQVREREDAKEIEECTFSPIFYTRVPHRSLNRSTSQLLHLSQERSPRSTFHSSVRRSGSAPRSYLDQYQRRVAVSHRESEH